MKKNRKINPLEQHFEKLVLVVVSLVLLGVVAMQFLAQPNAVRVGNSPPVPPDQVFDAVQEEAERLIAQMRSVSPELPEVPDQDVRRQFAQVSGLGGADSIRFSSIGTPVSIGAVAAADSGEGFEAATTYAMPSLPVPQSIAAASYRVAVSPVAWATNEELRQYLPAQQPFDLAAVSVEGVVSGQALRESLESDPDGEGGLRPLPLSWWRGGLELLGVEVEREELGTGGSWGNSTIVSGIPGEPSLLEEVRGADVTPIQLQQVSQRADAVMRRIAQPQFPPAIAGPEWVPPSELEEEQGLSEDDLLKSRRRKELERLDRQIAAKQEQLQDVGAGGGGGEWGRPGEAGGGGRRGGGGGGGGERRPSGTDRDARERERLERELAALEERRQRVVDQLADLGVFVDPAQAQQATGGQMNEPEPPIPDILEAESLPVWVHDLSAEPGKTYRYRMRVVLNNPLFGRGQFLAEGQQEAAASAVLEGEWSPWSAPVAMEADQHFFVVSASQDDALGNPPRAAVEVFEFYYGYWRRATTTLEPGDLVHARTRLPESLLIYDPQKLAEMGTRPRPGQGRVPGLEDEGGGGGRWLEQDERRRTIEGGGRGFEEPTRGTPTEAALPEGATRAPDWLEMNVPAMLLDVARRPGTKDAYEAVLRAPDGDLTVRHPDGDRAEALYRRLAASAREGETQGQPEPQAPQRPGVPPPAERERIYEDEGGGGGGGG